ncbi:unnamed protein product, partial [Gongylonema pulchrum]|uniref:Serine/threonine-protein phosphatase n=1 Tax=Gongylonema pulchrum TaxID=637853 RepID=A0A183DCB0_9BILA
MDVDINDLILRLLSVGNPEKGMTKTVKLNELMTLCLLLTEILTVVKTREIFKAQSPLIEIDPPVRICGDTHGQYGDLLRLFDRGGFPPTANYLFLGDYVDREFCIQVKYPNNFFMLRGNHECATVNRVYGFYEECFRRYASPQ